LSVSDVLWCDAGLFQRGGSSPAYFSLRRHAARRPFPDKGKSNARWRRKATGQTSCLTAGLPKKGRSWKPLGNGGLPQRRRTTVRRSTSLPHRRARRWLRRSSPASLLVLTLALALGATDGDAAQLNLSWVDMSGGQAAFSIERRTGSTATYAEIAQ